jgi:hypothetical protein
MASPHAPDEPTFQPRISLGIVYTIVLFFVYCLLFTAPALYEVLNSMPPGPEQEEMAKQVARQVVRPRLPLAFGAGALTTLLGVYLRVLPGFRRRR